MKSIYTILFFLLSFANSNIAQNRATSIASNQTYTIAPDFSFLDIQGNEHNLYHALDQGFIVVLDFFFVDCPPCIEAAPEIEAIHQDYEGKNVLIWSISDRDPDSNIIQYQNDNDITTTSTGLDGGGYEIINLYASNFNFIGFPTVSVVCPDKILNWDIFPYSTGAPEWRNAIENCGVEEITQDYVPINIATSVSDLEQNAPINAILFPNPASNQATLNIYLADSKVIDVNLLNTLGQSQKLISNRTVSAGQQELDLFLSDVPRGIYFLEIKSEDKVLDSLKFVKE